MAHCRILHTNSAIVFIVMAGTVMTFEGVVETLGVKWICLAMMVVYFTS